MAVLNSNPEILIRKRKDNDRKRLEKQEQARQRQQHKKKANNKFIRAETLISNSKSNDLEAKRLRHINKYEKAKGEIPNDEGDSKLLFVVRVPNHTKGLKIPGKVNKILSLLRLLTPNTGTFVKANNTTLPLLKLISPYVVVGNPSLNSIRKLFQKRACIKVTDDEDNEKIIKLDNNELVENKFGDDLGLICIEDLIHEIATLSESFKPITYWLMPFKLNTPISGWGAQAKLAKLQHANATKKHISLSGNASLEYIDIDKVIDEQN